MLVFAAWIRDHFKQLSYKNELINTSYIKIFIKKCFYLKGFPDMKIIIFIVYFASLVLADNNSSPELFECFDPTLFDGISNLIILSN